MQTTTTSHVVDKPTLHITQKRQRVKQFGDKIYLNNNEEFELEIFNPLDSKIMANISINGTSIGQVVIRQGQRAYLERFINENKKFLFQTYQVENNNSTVDNAIRNNGVVNIKFYKEKKSLFNIMDYITTSTVTTSYPKGTTVTYTNGNGVQLFDTIGSSENSFTLYSSGNVGIGGPSPSAKLDINGTFTSSSNVKGLFNQEAVRSRTLGGEPFRPIKNEVVQDELKETGTIEKGTKSNQTFTEDTSDYELFSFHQITWKILPNSERIKTVDEIFSYCGNCGAKRKNPNHRFCGHCGTEF